LYEARRLSRSDEPADESSEPLYDARDQAGEAGDEATDDVAEPANQSHLRL